MSRRLAMIVFNTMERDLRVHRQASTLAAQGYEVRVYAFLEAGLKEREKQNGYTIFREDQRGRLARFFDDKIMAGFKSKRPPQEQPLELEPVPDREPQRPCSRPQRELSPESSPAEREHRAYVRRINGVWAEKISAWRPHLVCAHDLDTLEAGVAIKKNTGCRLLYDTHELWAEQPFINNREAVDYWNRLEAELIADCDAVLTVNEPLVEELQQRYGHPRVSALYNCQELEPLPTEVESLRGDDGLPVAIYQGAFAPDRGLEQLIAAARHTRRVKIALRGSGSLEAPLRSLPGADKVLFLPPVPATEIVAGAAQADVGLIPFIPSCLNHYLSTPNKLFEYMMAGLPIAGADLPEMRKFVEGLELGLLFDPYSPADIARALDEMVDQHDLKSLGRRARQQAENRYHWGEESLKLVHLYGCLSQQTTG